MNTETRDRMVLALMSTTREPVPYRGRTGENGACAVQVICDGLGIPVAENDVIVGPCPIPSEFIWEISARFDRNPSFDEIAKWLKEQPVED